MSNRGFKTIDLKYKSADTNSKVYRQIRQKAKAYFETTGYTKGANKMFWYKVAIMLAITFATYFLVITTASIPVFFASYISLGLILLILGINIGHDAAHHAVTRKPKIDNTLFRIVFGIQGLSGYVWQIRHNNSHHVLPNVAEHDTDSDMGGIIIVEEHEPTKWIHRYQHLYAPLIYLVAGLVLLIYKDFEMMSRSKHGNIIFGKIPKVEWAKFFLVKVSHFTLLLGFPMFFSSFSWEIVLCAFVAMHFSVSIFMIFTFVISHHVQEVAHIETSPPNLINDSWVKHQIVSTIDFNENSAIANFIFGGFNLHVAHHIFPEISHIHYPALTKIIKETLEENGCGDWYKSYTFFDGCVSHIKYLKQIGRKENAIEFIPSAN